MITNRPNEDHNLLPLFAAFEEAEITYCIWKSVHKIADVAAGSDDLDLLLPRNAFADAVKVLANQGYFEVRKPWYKEDIGTASYSKIVGPGLALHVHLHTQIVFGNAVVRNYRLPIEHLVLATRAWNETWGVWTIDPKTDLCLFLTRHLVRTRLGRHVEFCAEYDLVVAFHDEATSQRHTNFPVGEVVSAVETGLDQVDLRQLRNAVTKAVATHKRKAAPGRNSLAFATASSERAKAMSAGGVPSHNSVALGGLIIPFVGIDGAGKSSALERAERGFPGGLPIERITLGSGQSGASLIRQLAFKLLGTKARFQGHTAARVAEKAAPAVGGEAPAVQFPWYYKLWLLICARDKRNEFRRGLSASSQGRIVLADRWPQSVDPLSLDSQRTSRMVSKGPLDRLLVSMERGLHAEVDRLRVPLIILLDVSPETSVQRKPDDLTFDQATKYRESLLAIDWNAERVVIVDADLSLDEVDRQIYAAISDALQRSDAHHEL